MLGSLEAADRKLWTREEASQLADLFPGQRYELIQGDLINKMGQKPPHAHVISVLNKLLALAFPGRVRIQSSIQLPYPQGEHSEPEPDVVLLHKESNEFAHRHPEPREIALVIEVADTSLRLDRLVKAPLYAASGIAEYWIVDIQGRRILTFREPAATEYASVKICDAATTVISAEEPAFSLSFEEFSLN